MMKNIRKLSSILTSLLLLTAVVVMPIRTVQAGQGDPQRPTPAAPAMMVPESGQAIALKLLGSPPQAGTSAEPLQAGGDRLVNLQQNDGGWDWPLDDGNPDDDSPKNTVGPIAMGLAQAYLQTGDPDHMTALEKAGDFLLAKTNDFSPSDGYLAAQLDRVFDVTTYTQHVKTYYYDKLAAGTYDKNGGGTLYDTESYVNQIRTSRAGSIANLAAWDVGMGLVGAASCGVTTTHWISGTKAEIDELDGDEWYDVIGLAGALYGLAFVDEDYDPTAGEHQADSNLNDLADTLASYQIDGGGFTWNSGYLTPTQGNEAIQETSYSILALNEVSRTKYLTDVKGAADYMIGVQLDTGGWKNYDSSSSENNEVTGEALWGISAVYQVWVDATTGDDTNSGRQDAPFGTVQGGISLSVEGGNIHVGELGAAYTGGLTIDKSLVLIADGDVVIGPGSHGTTVSADDVTLDGFTYDGTGCTGSDSGIYVNDGVEGLWIRNGEVKNWCDDGIHFAGDITDLKLVDNHIHDNGGDGVEFTNTPTTVQIYGNAFRDNTGDGINNNSGSVTAEYNEWGDIDGPTGTNGDGATNVDADPWVFGSLYVDPATQDVREGTQCTIEIKGHAENWQGVEFVLDYDETQVSVVSTTDGNFGGDETITDTGSLIEYNSYQQGTTEWDADPDVVLTVTLETKEGFDLPLTSLLDLKDVTLGAKDGVNIFVDSVTDGELQIVGTEVTGRVDLQGRDDDSGAEVDLGAGLTYSHDPDADNTDSWGDYTITDVTSDTYTVTVAMDLYLDASAPVTVTGDSMTLSSLKLLGGDASNDEVIDVSDATIIGNAFGTSSGGTGWNANADINADITVNILDLVLMGGNYNLASSDYTWSP